MDRKGIGILIAAFCLMLAWPALVNKIVPPGPPTATNTLTLSGTNLSGASNALVPLPAIPDLAKPVAPELPTAVLSASADRTAILENGQVRATFTSRGGGLKMVELKEYPAVVGCGKKDAAQSAALATLNDPAFSPAFVHYGVPGMGADAEYQLTSADGMVRAQRDVPGGLRITKEYRIASNYVFQVKIRYENTGAAPVAVPGGELVIGTAASPDRHETSEWIGAYWYDGHSAEYVNQRYFANATLGCIPGTPKTEFLAGSSNVVWGAAYNRFFAMIAVPDRPAQQVIVRDLALPKPTLAERDNDGRLNPDPRAYQTALVFPGGALPAGQQVEQTFSLYAGPKEYFTLSRMKLNMEAVMDLSGFTGVFAKALLLSLNGLHTFIPSYGWSIIALTVIIKGLFWPLTAISTRSMKRMQAIQPELQAIREKFKSEPAKMQEKTLECMKRHKVNPAAGCLPLLIQFPVFIGFFFMLRTAIELRGASFLWVCNLSAPDTLFTIPGLGWIPFLGVVGVGLPFNLLPLLMGATSLWMAHLTPMSPQMDPMQQKIMRYLPVFFVLFLYNYSSGLTLYWTAQNLLSVLQTKITKMSDEKTAAKNGSPPSAPAAPGKPTRKKA